VHAARRFDVAVLNGHEEIAALLRDSGASPGSLDAVETFLAACLRADRSHVERLRTADASNRGAGARARAARHHRAAGTGRGEAVRLLADLGFDVNANQATLSAPPRGLGRAISAWSSCS